MDPINSVSKSKKKNPTAAATPISPPMKSLPSKSLAPIIDEIVTPEKPTQTRGRRLAMSMKEVKKIAEGLRENKKVPLDRVRSDDDLSSSELSRPPRAKTPARLPEKYESLVEFFNSMDSSIRLIRMKGSTPTFPNICASIQNLTDRRFTYEHLAQLKYILPEVIVIKKVLLRDEVTCCMKPDLHVMLQVDAIVNSEKGKEDGSYSSLRRVFRERLASFSKEHPEGEDVPEHQLPHPFNQTKAAVPSNSYSPSVQPTLDTFPEQQFAVPSHMPRSFQRRFSQKVLIPESQKIPLECYKPLNCVVTSPIKCTIKPPLGKKSLLGFPTPPPSSGILVNDEEEDKKSAKSDDNRQKELHGLDGTPAKLVSTPARLMVATPEIRTPKRCLSPTDYDSSPLKKSKKRSARTKLFTTPKKDATKDNESIDEGSSVDDVIGFLPQSLLQSVREKERKALEDKDAGVVQGKRRQKLIAGLPDTFDMMLLMFQSWKRSVMTKQELMYKLIANNCKIVDKGEVEEQVKLLQELVPEWISENTASSGDILCCVSKLSSPEEIRQRLAEAE